MTTARSHLRAAAPRSRRFLRFWGLVSVLAVSACGSIDEVDVTRSAEVVVPGAAGSPPLSGTALTSLDLVIDRRALAENGVDPNDVDSARLVGLRLEVLQGTSLDAWLESVAFYAEAPGIPRTLIAQKSGIGALPAGTNTVELDVPGVDLKPFVLADTAQVTAEVTGTQPPLDTTLRATATIRVDVNVSGLFD